MSNSGKVYNVKRYDLFNDRSLKPYSAADEYLLQNFASLSSKPKEIAIYHDRFGYLTCHLNSHNPYVILTEKSQEKAIDLNLKANDLSLPKFSDPLSALETKIDFALIKVPKSLALFELFLEQISQNSTDDVSVSIAFMTRHFSPNLLKIAEKYFDNVEQSRAVKKARIATLTKKKQVDKQFALDVLNYNDHAYKQYWGVFSAKHIDYATQYFLEHLEISPTDNNILDLASGNGIIAKEILTKLPSAEIHLMDDSFLAVESAKLNIQGENVNHHFNNDLSIFDDEAFDLIVSNPPFHFEYEINIQIPIQLFKECYRCLKPGGNLQIVASKHLNYMTHLKPVFSTVEILAQNDKFVIYKCVKP